MRSGGGVVVVVGARRVSLSFAASVLEDTRGDEAGDVDVEAEDTDDDTEGEESVLDALRDEPDDELRRIVVVVGCGVLS
jgi:hypothetical protein